MLVKIFTKLGGHNFMFFFYQTKDRDKVFFPS